MILALFRPRVLALAAVLVLVAGGATAAAYYWSQHRHPESASAKKQLWTCSMHPQVLKDQPGLCPICHMELVPVKEQSSGQPNDEKAIGGLKPDDVLQIRLEPTVMQQMSVRTEIVKRAPIRREIRGIAHIEFNETNQAMINSRVNGWVEKLYARYTGQPVRRGQALAGIYSPELVSTQEEYLQLHRRLEAVRGTPQEIQMQALVSAARKRLRYWNISAAQIASIEKNQKVERLLTLYSPYSGVLVEKNVIQGAAIKQGMDLFKVVDLSTVWAFVHLPEKDIPFVSEGMPAEMVVTQIPGKTFRGQVSFIFPYMDRETRDLKVRVSFGNPGFQLRPGMYATLILKSGLKGQHLVVPLSAVIRTGERALAFVYRGGGIFEPREVHVGVAAGDDRLQILHGLAEGEAVVVSGQFLLDSETRIQEAVRKMRGQGGGTKGLPGGHQH